MTTHKRNNIRLHTLVAFLALAGLAGSTTASAAILDDFSSSNPEDYNQYRSWGSGTATFAVSGGVFDPSQSSNNTFGWMWNGGSAAPNTLNPGESISVDVSPEAFETQPGFRIAGSLVSDGSTSPGFSNNGVDDSYILVRPIEANDWKISIDGSLTSLTGNASADTFVNLEIARGVAASQNVLTVTVSGAVSGSTTHTMTGFTASDPMYFAMDRYTGGGADTGQFDNLTHVPEPATMTLLAIGGFGVLLKRRRHRA